MKSAIRSPKLEIWPFVRFWLIKRPLRPLAWPSPFIGFGPHMPRRPPRSPRFASLGNLFRDDGAGLPWLSRKLRPEDCFGKPDGPAPSAKITERARATARVCHGCRRPRSPRFASLGNLFREARWGNFQRQNDGSECEGGCRRSFGRRPENCFGKPDGPAPSAKITERARATARVCHGCRGSFGRRPESCCEKPDGPAPSVKITGASASDAPSEAVADAEKVFLGSPTGLTPASKRRGRAFGQPDGPDPSPNPRRFFASRKMARDAPGPGCCEP